SARSDQRAAGGDRADNAAPPAYTLPAVPGTNAAPGAAAPGDPPAPNSAPTTGPEPAGPRNQRPPGTTYGGPGGYGAGQLTMALPGGDPLENSGSLTGHILSQGRVDAPATRSSTTKVIVIGLLMLVVLVAAGLIAATVAGDALTDLFSGLINS
ncbi:MAG TPA: hypothetical protein VES42_08015, partial [Pilimelia sp.]|nr:hypothetical protein [Pilimelia sp.]